MKNAPQLIAVHGFKQSGKDTLAKVLVEEFGYRRLAFADRVKDAIHIIFGVNREWLFGSDQDKQRITHVRWEDLVDVDRPNKDNADFLSVRELLQIFATEVCRSKCPSIWYRYLPIPADERIVISDLRFENEALFLKEKNAVMVKVRRPQVEGGLHESEKGLPDSWMARIIDNDSSLEDFHTKVRAMMGSFEFHLQGGKSELTHR